MSDPKRNEDGTWSYSDEWTPADREAWEATCGELVHHEKRVEQIESAGVALLSSPAVALAAKRAEVDAAKQRAEMAERIAKGRVAWVQARAAHGNLVRLLVGEEGDHFIMRVMERDEVTAANQRSDDIIEGIKRNVPENASEEDRLKAERRAWAESIAAQEDELFKHVTIGGLDVAASTERLRALSKRYAGLRPMLFGMRDLMIKGWRDDEGKGLAPS